MSAHCPLRRAPRAARERGQAMLLTVLLLGIGVSAVVYNFVTPAKQAVERDRITAAALAQAKAALVGFAAGVNLAAGASRPGDLPCPDQDNDGDADAVPACGTSALALGRLPWRTLGLPDLRDGAGERLWYAVSANFKNNPRTACINPGDAGCLNSDTRGTITLRGADGAILNDGTNPDPYTPSGIVAVIIAPGAVLKRQGAAAPQDRSPAGINTPQNYLDVGNGEDNAAFADVSTDGFIQGPIYDASRNLIVNDRLLPVTYADVIPLLERRVAKEALNCLESYAADPKNKGRYPWASSLAASSGNSPYNDSLNNRFGRLPDDMTNTVQPNANATTKCTPLVPSTPAFCMTYGWPAACTLTQGTWWTNWKNLAMYGVADNYKPNSTLIMAIPLTIAVSTPAPCGSCLTVDPPSAVADKRVVIIVAGKRLSGIAGGQPRGTNAERSTAGNYVEGENDWTVTSADTFVQQASPSFNDRLLFRQ